MENGFLLAAHAVQQLAVVLHGLNQILGKSVLHNINTYKIECKKFCFVRREQCTAQSSVEVL